MSTTAENLQELLPAASPSPAPNLLPELPAPPGVTTQTTPQEPQLMSATAPRTAASSGVTSQQTVAGQMGDLLSESSPYIQQARGRSTQQAAARGLQNSSIAAQAGEQAAISAALPIASQDASTHDVRERDRLAAENNLIGMREGGDITSRLQSEAAQQQLTAQQRQIAQQQWLAQFDAQTQTALQSVDLATRERMQAAGFTQEQALQAAQVASQQWLAQFDASTRERLQGLDNDVRLTLQQLDIDAQERVANLNVNSASRSDASRMAASFELAYSTMLQTIMNNPDIPAAERQSYMDHANAMRDSNIALVEQMFNVDLEW